MVKVEIDTADYPLYESMRDPAALIVSIIDRDYSAFASQHAHRSVAEISDQIRDTMEPAMDEVGRVTADMRESLASVAAAIQNSALKMANSASKGAIVEVIGEQILKEGLDSKRYSVTNTSKIPHSGDHIISVAKTGFSMMVDWKDYGKNTPAKEVTKLKRDMAEQNVRCGLIVNATKGVTGYDNIDMDLFNTDDGQLSCMLVLGNVKECPMLVTIAVYYMESIFKKLLANKSFETEPTNEPSRRDEFADILMETHTLTKLIKSLATLREGMQSQIDSFNTELVGTIREFVTKITLRLTNL
jgi:hypothetical protein